MSDVPSDDAPDEPGAGRAHADDEPDDPRGGPASADDGPVGAGGGTPSPDDTEDDPPARGQAGDPPARGMLVERAAAMGVAPSPPPRRTGVFVDVEELRGHVGGLLRSMLGGYEVDALGNFTFTADGARIFITVGPGPMGPHVGVFSIVTVDLALTPDLAAFLLTTNNRMAFGAFSYEPAQRAVWLRHSLLGATLDGPELRSAVISIAATAGKVTELLRERFGAGTYADASEERKRAVHPPEPDHGAPEEAANASGYL